MGSESRQGQGPGKGLPQRDRPVRRRSLGLGSAARAGHSSRALDEDATKRLRVHKATTSVTVRLAASLIEALVGRDLGQLSYSEVRGSDESTEDEVQGVSLRWAGLCIDTEIRVFHVIVEDKDDRIAKPGPKRVLQVALTGVLTGKFYTRQDWHLKAQRSQKDRLVAQLTSNTGEKPGLKMVWTDPPEDLSKAGRLEFEVSGEAMDCFCERYKDSGRTS